MDSLRKLLAFQGLFMVRSSTNFARKLKSNDIIDLVMHEGKPYMLYFTGDTMDEDFIHI